MQRLWRSLNVGILAVALYGGPLVRSAPAQEPQSPRAYEEALAHWDSQIAEVERQISQDPDHPALWQQLITLKSMRWSAEQRLRGMTVDEASSRAQARRLVGEWIEAQPWNPKAYLLLATFERNAQEQADELVDLTERFPKSPEVYERALQALQRTGELERADALAERFAAAHPELPESFALAFRHYHRQGDGGRAAEVLERWLAAHPGDARALSHWLAAESLGNPDPARIRSLAQRAVDQVQPGPQAARLCGQIGGMLGGEFRELGIECYLDLLAADTSPEEKDRLIQGLAELRGVAEDVAGVRSLIDSLPAESQDRVLLSLASQRAYHEACEEALELLAQVASNGQLVGSRMAVVFSYCAGDPRLEDRLLERARRLDSEGLRSLLFQWSGRAPSEGIEKVALERLQQSPADEDVWRGLDQLYEKTHQLEKRADLLETWTRSGATGEPASSSYSELAEVLSQSGRTEEAIELLEEITSKPPYADSPYFLEKLANLYLGTSRLDEAEVVARRLLEREDSGRGGRRGDLLLARIAWLRDEPEVAVDGYRRYLSRSTTLEEEVTAEFAYLAMALGREADVARLLEQRYEVLQARGAVGGGREAWVGQELQRLGFAEAALAYLEAALEHNPNRADLHRLIAELAEWLEDPTRAEAGLRRYIELDPKDPVRWQQLADYQLRAGEAAPARQTIQQAFARLGQRPFGLRLLLAKSYLAEDNVLEAIRELRALVDDHPQSRAAENALIEAYRLLGEDEEGGDTEP